MQERYHLAGRRLIWETDGAKTTLNCDHLKVGVNREEDWSFESLRSEPEVRSQRQRRGIGSERPLDNRAHDTSTPATVCRQLGYRFQLALTGPGAVPRLRP